MSSERLIRLALVVLVVGLALHNVAMAQLWDLGLRGTALDAAAAWKDALLARLRASLPWRLARELKQGLRERWARWRATRFDH